MVVARLIIGMDERRRLGPVGLAHLAVRAQGLEEVVIGWIAASLQMPFKALRAPVPRR